MAWVLFLVVLHMIREIMILQKNIKFEVNDKAYTDGGYMINSSFLNGLEFPNKSITKTIEYLEEKNLGKKKINFRLKDWGISRQHYRGCPIPIIYDENDQAHPLPVEKLPV